MRHTIRALLSVLVVISCCRCAPAETLRRPWWLFGGDKESPYQTAPSATTATTTAPAFTPSPALPPSEAITPIGPDSSPSAGTSQAAASAAVSAESLPHAPLPSAQSPVAARDPDRPPIFESPFPKVKWPSIRRPDWSYAKSPEPPVASDQAQVDPRPRNSWVEKTPEPPKPSPIESVKNGAHRVANSTRNAWRKTVDAITPGEEDHRTGSRIASRDVKPPFWQRMMGAEEPQRQEQTISGFVGQPRP